MWAWLPWLLLAVLGVVRRPGRAAGRRAGARRGGCSSSAGTRSRASTSLAAGSLFALLALSRIDRSAWRRAVGRLVAGAGRGRARWPRSRSCRSSSCWRTRPTSRAREQADPLHLERALPARLRAARVLGPAVAAPRSPAFLVARAFYVGALPLMLAAWALVLRPTRERVAVAAAAAVALAVVIGVPACSSVVTALPGLRRRAQHAAGRCVACLALALLAGWGLDDLAERRRARPRLLVGGRARRCWPCRGRAWSSRACRSSELGDGAARSRGAFADARLGARSVAMLGWPSLLVWIVLGAAPPSLLCGCARSGRLAASGVRRAGLRAGGARPAARSGMGINPRSRSSHAEQPVTPGDPRPAGGAARRASPA